MGRELPRQQEPPRNGDLLGLEIAWQTNDFHPIAQRLRNGRQRIGGREEEHLRQVVIHFEEVVVKGVMLLGVEHFQQCRRRIATPVTAKLVDLVEQDHGIDRFRAPHGLNHTAGQRADIGSTMPADFGFITHTAKRHADKLASEGVGD